MAVKLDWIGHVNLTVWDVERSKEFYSKVLGFEVVEQDPMPRSGQGVHVLAEAQRWPVQSRLRTQCFPSRISTW